LVQVPPRGIWGSHGLPTWAPADDWLGRPLEDAPSVERLILRYLAAFGPAAPADFRRWSRLTGLREEFDRMRPDLVTFTDERNRELFDVPDAPRVDEDSPAPPRFLPAFDNISLSHADRSRIVDDAYLRRGAIGKQSFTVDGFIEGTWRLAKDKGKTTVVLEPFAKLRKSDRTALAGEGAALLAFVAPGEDHDVAFLD
jgi:hypothetical protein